MILGKMDSDAGVINLLSLVIPREFAAPTSSILVCVLDRDRSHLQIYALMC